METAEEFPRLVVALQLYLTEGNLFWQPDPLNFDVKDFRNFRFFDRF